MRPSERPRSRKVMLGASAPPGEVIVFSFIARTGASLFYLPRTLVNLAESAEAGEPEAVRLRLLLMGRRLYKFGHMMFGFAFLAGLLLWQGYRVFPQSFPNVAAGMGWLHAKLGLVAVLLAFFVWCG